MTDPTALPSSIRRPPYRRSLLLLGVVAVAVLLFAVYALSGMTGSDDPDGGLRFVIPAGAADGLDLPTIDSAIVIPTSIVFPQGEPAVLSIKNDDGEANRAGPWVIGAGQTYTIAFDEPGVYEYVCSVDAAESVTITVE